MHGLRMPGVRELSVGERWVLRRQPHGTLAASSPKGAPVPEDGGGLCLVISQNLQD